MCTWKQWPRKDTVCGIRRTIPCVCRGGFLGCGWCDGEEDGGGSVCLATGVHTTQLSGCEQATCILTHALVKSQEPGQTLCAVYRISEAQKALLTPRRWWKPGSKLQPWLKSLRLGSHLFQFKKKKTQKSLMVWSQTVPHILSKLLNYDSTRHWDWSLWNSGFSPLSLPPSSPLALPPQMLFNRSHRLW